MGGADEIKFLFGVQLFIMGAFARTHNVCDLNRSKLCLLQIVARQNTTLIQ